MSILDRFLFVASEKNLVKALAKKGFYKNTPLNLEAKTAQWKELDVADFKRAFNAANASVNPRYGRLYDILDKVQRDSHTKALMENRVLNILSAKFTMLDQKGNEQAEATEILKKPWFEKFLRLTVESIFYPASLIELTEWTQGNIEKITLISRKHTKHAHNIIVKREHDTTGWDYTKAPLSHNIIPLINDDFGILCDIAPLVILKIFVINYWASYVQNNGIPARYAVMKTNDKTRQKELFEMMQYMISKGVGVIQGEEEIKMLANPSADASSIFDQFIIRIHSDISKRMLGNDAMTDNKDSKGTYGSLQVLADVAEDRYTADKMFVKNIVNHHLIPRLTAHFGYPATLNNFRFEWDNFQDLKPKEVIDAISKISTNFDIDEDYILKKTGIPVKRRETPMFDTSQATAKKKSSNPLAIGFPKYERCSHTEVVAKGIRVSIEKTIQQFYDEPSDISPDNYHQHVERFHKAIEKGFGDIEVEYDKPDHATKAMMEMNLYRFSVAKSLAMASRMNEHLKKSKSFADFKRIVEADRDIRNANTNYLETEYNYAINASASAARYHEFVAQKDVLPFWQYKTMNDGAVRDSHRRLHNKIFNADDSVFNRIYPPNGWGCRCEVVPVKNAPGGVTKGKDGLTLLGDELDKMKKSHMDINRAKANFIFSEAQFYTKDLEGFDRATARMGVKDFYGSEDYNWKNIKNKFKTFKTDIQDTEAAQNWFDKRKNDKGVVLFKDYNKRPVQLSKETLELKMSKQGENRYKLVDNLENILQNPSEVWLESASIEKYDITYFGFFKNKAVKIPVRVFKNGIQVKSFYEEKKVDEFRKGILIKKTD
ncbi:phage putative head morphogenesis protein, SPP1 gp7 family [Elysia marginata]|uniref:Phage putative head morphogenesis protein, SPP1 gp7 family n=1 Tax=Elysia marginata TaxID=1093978 RepID=A0AAV4GXZ4_9GAST|nr:phage putative head morphogenesis protein, SPP1 gp7 family [Elysia marginata]